MTMGGREKEMVMLLPHRVNMRLSKNNSNQDPVDLPLFNIIRLKLTQRNRDCFQEGNIMILVLRRKPWREVFTIIKIIIIIAVYFPNGNER